MQYEYLKKTYDASLAVLEGLSWTPYCYIMCSYESYVMTIKFWTTPSSEMHFGVVDTSEYFSSLTSASPRYTSKCSIWHGPNQTQVDGGHGHGRGHKKRRTCEME